MKHTTGTFIILFLVLLYGCSYYLYNKDVHHAAQNFFNKNFKHKVTVTHISFNPFAPVCLNDKVLVSLTSQNKSGTIPMYTIGCALTPNLEIDINPLDYLSLKLNGI